jgi:aminopeptidase N
MARISSGARPAGLGVILGLGLGLGLLAASAGLAACSGSDGGDRATDAAPASADGEAEPGASRIQDIRSTALEIDLAGLSGRAVIEVRPAAGSGEVRLDAAGLDVAEVRVGGASIEAPVRDGVLHVPVSGDAAQTIEVGYGFQARAGGAFDGWMPGSGVSFLWPTHCDNLFPCDVDPADGSSFTLAVSGASEDAMVVAPASIPAAAPSYMPAIAVGDYREIALGATAAGTLVSVFHLAGSEARAASGTAHLVAVIDFLERRYGAYRFGPKIASVEAAWGPGAFGGMEHHPYFHVAAGALASEEVNAHEAAHGWFGDGVRLACWEDFVLSEGTVSYLAARALAEAGGPDLWPGYARELEAVCAGPATAALPDSCGVIDLAHDPLWSNVPYMKGACFLEEVADSIGEATVDDVLAAFYAAHDDRPARMDDLIAALAAAAGAEGAAVDALAEAWLRTASCPVDAAARCADSR